MRFNVVPKAPTPHYFIFVERGMKSCRPEEDDDHEDFYDE